MDRWWVVGGGDGNLFLTNSTKMVKKGKPFSFSFYSKYKR